MWSAPPLSSAMKVKYYRRLVIGDEEIPDEKETARGTAGTGGVKWR